MAIVFNEETKQFHLFNESLSYIMELVNGEYLIHTYYGEKIEQFNQGGAYPKVDRSSFSPNPAGWPNRDFSLDVVLQEFPGFDTGDYRESAFEATYADGTKATALKYHSHTIFAGKRVLEGLPATYICEETEAETLEITLKDKIRGLAVILSYTIYAERAVITKSVRYVNESSVGMVLNKAFSSCVDYYDSEYEMLQLPGAWSREKQMERDSLATGIHILDSKRGASGVAQQPFMALLKPTTTESTGEVWATHFIYSGNFSIVTEVDNFGQTRVLTGISDHNFIWNLAAGESFQAPEVVHVYSNQGLNGMSQTFHHLYRERLVRGEHQFKERPLLINNWETTYFDFDEAKLVGLAKEAKKIGVELFVLDDGWFKERNDDTTSLGDWVVDQKKLPNGLKGLSEKIHQEGLQFGLWFEPEMISHESDLFKAHPDWHIHVEGYPTTLGRNQLILDFSRQEVRDEIFDQMTAILDDVQVDYIKWDMNRNMTEVGSIGQTPSAQMETSHRYMLGLYEFADKLTSRYPHILFENCSGGGGRFDAGMSYYMAQSWASDNTDAIERLKIQYGTSLVFPPVMICSQISEAPNHQVGRITDVETRAAVAMSANMGIMLDLQKETKEDLAILTEKIDWYKKHRHLIHFGDFYRLENPFEKNYGSWQFIDATKNNGVLVFVQILSSASKPFVKVKLQGLDPHALYEIKDMKLSGDELMKYGLFMNHDLTGDFKAHVIEFRKVK